MDFRLVVDVAQLVEPRIVIPVVAGSIPVVHPNFNIYINRLEDFKRKNNDFRQYQFCNRCRQWEAKGWVQPSRPPQFVASRNRGIAKNRHMGIESIGTQKPIN